MPIQREQWRFFDPAGGVPDPTDPDTALPALVRLERILDDEGRERFRLRRSFGYLDRVSNRAVVAPHDLELGDQDGDSDVSNDLTSVPSLFAWLVPRTGSHLPAAIIHDSTIGPSEHLVLGATPGVPVNVVWQPSQGGPSPIDAVEADRIFRDAMADSGTRVVRRWLIWTAVTLRTMLARDGTSSASIVRWYYATIVSATLFSIAWLGYQATNQLFLGDWPCTYDLFWMRSELPGALADLPAIGEGYGARLASGALFALLIPVALGLLWGRFRAAGMIAGVALAFVLHITLAVLLLTALYQLVEAVATDGKSGLVRWIVGLATRQTTLALVAAAIIVLACLAVD